MEVVFTIRSCTAPWTGPGTQDAAAWAVTERRQSPPEGPHRARPHQTVLRRARSPTGGEESASPSGEDW